MPNPTNSVVANKDLIYSEPQSAQYRDYLDKEMKSIGVKAKFRDMWAYFHIGDGNLLCSSYSISYCKPLKK